MILKLTIILSFVYLSTNSAVSNDWNCDLFYHFARVCHRFDYGNNFCNEWDTTLCDIVKTTYNDYRCPTYICVSGIYVRM